MVTYITHSKSEGLDEITESGIKNPKITLVYTENGGYSFEVLNLGSEINDGDFIKRLPTPLFNGLPNKRYLLPISLGHTPPQNINVVSFFQGLFLIIQGSLNESLGAFLGRHRGDHKYSPVSVIEYVKFASISNLVLLSYDNCDGTHIKLVIATKRDHPVEGPVRLENPYCARDL